MRVFSHLLKKPASSSLAACLSSRIYTTAGLHDEKIHSYVEVVISFSMNYATKDIIAQASKQIEHFCHILGVLASINVKELYSKALHRGIVNVEEKVKSLFVKGLLESVYDNVCIHWSRNTSSQLTHSSCDADNIGKITDRRIAPSTSNHLPDRVLFYKNQMLVNVIRKRKDNLTLTTSYTSRGTTISTPAPDRVIYCKIHLTSDHDAMKCLMV